MDYVKISFEDMNLAKEFFDNEKHYKEWLFMVVEYYQGNKEIQSSIKIVNKYFNNYKKTMNYVIQAREHGKKGALQKAEKQQVKDDTLNGYLEMPESTQSTNNNINNKNNINNNINNKESNIFTNITTHTSNAKNLQERECDFQNLVYSELQERTEKEEIDKFILYWTEPNKSKSKMKFESEKFFDVKRRFVTWIGNVKPKHNQPTYTNKKNNLNKSDMLQVIQGMDKYQLGDFIKKYYNSFYTQMISDSRLDDENTRRGAVEWLINTKQPENI